MTAERIIIKIKWKHVKFQPHHPYSIPQFTPNYISPKLADTS